MRVAVLGAGGHAKVTVATLRAMGYTVAYAFDDDEKLWGADVLGVPVVGPLSESSAKSLPMVAAFGYNDVRRRVVERLGADVDWISAVHPHALVHESATMEPGAVVFAGAVIQPGVTVGAHAIVNTGATVDHDCMLGAFTHVAPGVHLAGNVRIGMGTLVGIGASCIPNITIGDWSVVGAGAIVICDVPSDVVALGVPARVREN